MLSIFFLAKNTEEISKYANKQNHVSYLQVQHVGRYNSLQQY